jgi:hypothetical protein
VSSLDEAARQVHIAGVKANLQLAQAAAQALGDVPPILSAPGFLEHGPDEKAIVVFLSFLCARVLEVSKEDRAAQVIQHFFRQRKSHQPGQEKRQEKIRIHLLASIYRKAKFYTGLSSTRSGQTDASHRPRKRLLTSDAEQAWQHVGVCHRVWLE